MSFPFDEWLSLRGSDERYHRSVDELAERNLLKRKKPHGDIVSRWGCRHKSRDALRGGPHPGPWNPAV
jgi:hypothetical protein